MRSLGHPRGMHASPESAGFRVTPLDGRIATPRYSPRPPSSLSSSLGEFAVRRVATPFLSIILVSLAFVTITPLAIAADVGDPCHLDRQRLCGHVADADAQRLCLFERRADASPACRARIAASSDRRARIPDARIACSDDASRLCAGVELGRGNLGRCLHDHEAELSAGCRDALRMRSEGRPSP